MIANISDSAIARLKKLEGSLTALIRRDAARAGWPKNLAVSLRVSVNPDGLSVHYPDSSADAIEDLEYGTPGTSPRPVFRKFMNNHVSKVNAVLEQFISDRLAELEAK